MEGRLQTKISTPRTSLGVNLERSLQILDEAVGSPPSILRSRKRPTLRHSSYTPGNTQVGVDTLSSSVFPEMLPDMTMKLDDSLLETTVCRKRQSEVNAQEITSSNITMLLEGDPELAESPTLYGNFHRLTMAKPTEHEILSLMEDFVQVTSERESFLRSLAQKAAPGQPKLRRVIDSWTQLSQEHETWKLLHTLYFDRLQSNLSTDYDETMDVDLMGPNITEREIIDNLYKKDSLTRQNQLVIDWLEQSAAAQLDFKYDKVEYFTDSSAMWENTLHYLKQRGKTVQLRVDRPLIDEFDPDAPIRQNKPLADLDKEDEVRLLKYVFGLLRAGQLDEAQRLCVKCGQSWRAATLEGWKLFHDPNYSNNSTVQPNEGNPTRDIWKAVCWRMCEEERYHLYERAIYAALSGNLNAVLPACVTWEDCLWAYYRVMVDTRIEQEIRTTSIRSHESLPPAYYSKVLTPESIFEELQSSSKQGIAEECSTPFHVIQKCIILNDIDMLLDELDDWLEDHEKYPQPQLLRFMTHLVIFLKVVGLETKDEVCVSVIEAYVQFLINKKYKELVAFYASMLPQDGQVYWYAKFLEDIRGTDERRKCLTLASEAGLDVPVIAKRVVENIRNRDISELTFAIAESSATLDTATSSSDRQKIEAIDWLVFDETQRTEAVKQANAIMRMFLGLKKHMAAKEVFHKIPSDSIDVIMRLTQLRSGSTDLSAEDDNAIREYLCMQAYLDAQDSFNDWFEQFHHGSPEKPVLAKGASFTESVTYEHKLKQYEADMQRWTHSIKLQTKATTDKLFNVLLFAGGWLVDQRMDCELDECRQNQLDLLRQLYIPMVAVLIHTVLQSTKQYQECLQLADYVASEKYQLYKAFRKEELKKFLELLRESSLHLLAEENDPLGYGSENQ